MSYFSTLNYTLANEDTRLELELLPENVGHVFSVAGSGGRVLPLLAKKPKQVTCVDLAQEQLYLCELRFESVKALEWDEFVSFWGYPPKPASPELRKMLFLKIAPTLTKECKSFFENFFVAKKWDSLLYDGRWENTFSKLSAFNRKCTGKRGAGLFDAKTMDEQRLYLKRNFPWLRWKFVLFALGNATVFNALLYKGHFPKKNIPESMYRFYVKAFDRLFTTAPARENFFLQLVFFGRVLFEEGNPVECEEKVFNAAKSGLSNVDVKYQRGDLVEVAQKSKKKIDFFSFSDVPSYFQGEKEKNFLQWIKPQLAKDATVVIRHYLHLPQNWNTQGFLFLNDQHAPTIAKEKVQVYNVDILKNLN